LAHWIKIKHHISAK